MPTASPHLSFAIIGAGLAGIMSAIRLEAAGYDDVVIFEKGARAGGTWRDNTYPGVACDIPSHFYSYSFALNPAWSRRYAPGAEINAYIDDVMRRHGVEQRIRFNEEVIRCEFVAGRWQLTTRSGSQTIADVVIAATGITHHPKMPSINGLDTFKGDCFHSARWNHEAVIDHRRVGVIGTGSTAVQIVSAIVDRVAKLSLFQRSAQWIMPQENADYTSAEKAAFSADENSLRQLREKLARRFTESFSDAVIDLESPQFKAIEALCLENLEQQVRDPALRERLRPNYRPACKRLVISADFYQAIQKPNAELVTENIARVEANGIRTLDGKLHELDVIVLATGFATDRFVRPMQVIGRDNTDLNSVWAKRPYAHLAVTMPNFPNFFLLNGPNSPAGNFPLIEAAEVQMNYILQLIDKLRTGQCREISVAASSAKRLEAEHIAAAKKTVWMTGCTAWFLDADGIPFVWPWSIERFYREMSQPAFEDYEQVS